MTPEPEPRICWAVSNGEYSDYGVNKVFEQKTDAEDYANRFGGHVEEFDYGPAGYRPPEITVYTADSRGYQDINVSSWTVDDWGGSITKKYRRPQPRETFYGPLFENQPYYMPLGAALGWHITAECIDRDAAIKSVKDRVAQKKALDMTP